MPQASLDALDEAGVFRMMAPKKYGGDEASFETQCRVLADIARGCPSTSWVATIYSAMAWVVSVFPTQRRTRYSPAASRAFPAYFLPRARR